jgi:hypothetical protein
VESSGISRSRNIAIALRVFLAQRAVLHFYCAG